MQIDFLKDAIENSNAIEVQSLLEAHKFRSSARFGFENYQILAKTMREQRERNQNNTDISFLTVGCLILCGAMASGWSAFAYPNSNHPEYEYTGCGFGLGVGLEILSKGFVINKTKYHNALAIESLLENQHQ